MWFCRSKKTKQLNISVEPKRFMTMTKQIRYIFICILLLLIFLGACEKEKPDCDFNNDGEVSRVEQKKCDQKNAEVPIKQENGGTPLKTAYPTTAFISVHMEPGNKEIPNWPETYWPDLINLIALADDYNVKLTLAFNPQWGTYILADNQRLALLRSWEENGHEIALHHHGPHHANWNGYTNQEEYMDDKDYIGTVEDMMNIVNQLPASGQILTAGIGAIIDQEKDWPNGVLYDTNGGPGGISDLLSTPAEKSHNGKDVIELLNAAYMIGTQLTIPQVSISQMLEAFETAKEGEIVGIAFHEYNYAEQPNKFEELFQFFQEQNIEVKTVQEIMKNNSRR